MPGPADAARPVFSRPRWLRGSTRPSGSAIWARSSSSFLPETESLVNASDGHPAEPDRSHLDIGNSVKNPAWLQHDVLFGLSGAPGLGNADGRGGMPDFGAQSCEQLAERVAAAFRARHGPGRRIEREVLEDGILGAGVRWPA